MSRWLSRPGRTRHWVLSRRRLRAVTLVTVIALGAVTCVPAANALPALRGGGVPAVKMFGYAAGPAQQLGSAAGKSHYVPPSATQAHAAPGSIKGHPAPAPDLAPPAMGTRTHVTVGAARMSPGREVNHHLDVVAGSNPPAAPSSPASPPATPSPASSPSATPSSSPSASPSPGPSASGTATTASRVVGTGTDNATYSVASTYDTVPMANQSGRIAVTLTNTGTSTWGSGYALGTQVFPASDTTGTGTPLTTGDSVAIKTTVAPGASLTVEGITPAETPGSYTLCWDMLAPSGQYFSDEGGNEYCAPYTIQQYAPVINEQEPLPGTSVDTQTPQLTASATVPGGYPAVPAFWFAFQVYDSSTPSSTLQSSGWIPGNGNSWTPTALTWGHTYYWKVTVSDAATPPSVDSTTLTWTTPISFVVGNAQPAVTYRFGNKYQAGDGNPVMTSDLGSTDYSGSGKMVDPKTANVSQQVTDASVAAAGPPLSIVRTYNSLDPRTSQALGAGWSSSLDMSLVPDPDGSGALIFTLADGQQVRFAKNAAGGYAPPQDKYAVISALSGGGFAVTDQSGTTYSFGQASGTSWLISQITDASGRSETFTYSAGALTTITSTTSGRALHLTWSTPGGATYAHVASVSTDPVTAGQAGTALTWTYGYSGDLLTSVCPPGTTSACTKYTYVTNGSHAPTSVLNANPTSYYRLDEPASATVAVNQIPVNDLTTMDPPASEFSTTPGVAGPVPGVTATGFNGTSSFIPLDGAWCTTPGQVSSCIQSGDSGRVLGGTAAGLGVSVWFKTSTASGVLVGLTPALPGSTGKGSGGAPENLLWIGSNGDLEGYASCGATCTWMSSTVPVDDGAWHQAVLIPGQALYVDGKKVATFTGTSTPPAGGDALLGAGETGNPVSGTYTWSYFNGSMADLSIYQNQLPNVGTVAAQYAAETHPAAELSSVTSPGGRTELSASYDTVNDRVATLTDTHGGTWAYGGPVAGSSSAAYNGTVLGSSPEDFWPLSDSSGPLVHDMVGGAATAATPRPPATFTNVTLGMAGPTGFPDGTAAGFSGSGSQVSIPGGYFAGNGAESAELWFQTTTAGGTLLSANTPNNGGNPPALWISAKGCLQGTLGAAQLTTLNGTCVSGQVVTDGKWHQAILTLTPITTSNGLGSGTESQTATLYLDGAVLNSAQITSPATLSSTGYVAYVGNGPDGDFAGSIADVSLYTRELTSSEVSGHYSALHNKVSVQIPNSNPALPPSYLTTPTLNTQTIAVTDPASKNAQYVYASGNLVRAVDALGGITYYGYDSANRASTITDADGNTMYATHDAHNNVTSTTTCAASGNCQTAYTSYYENLSNVLDPRNDKPTDNRDARSSSPSDPAYDSVITYTAAAQVASQTTPPTAACSSGCRTTYAYTAGTEPAVGGGTEPAGLLASVTAPGGGVTSYAYDSAGDVARVTSPVGLVTSYTYDNLGHKLTETQISDSFPNGLTTSYAYDGQDRLVTQTDPAVTNRVTGAVHTKVTSYTYDPDGNVLTTTVSDSTGGDPSRTTTQTYDAYGNLASAKDPLGNTTSYTYDGLGDRTSQTNPASVTTAYTYDAAGNLLTTTLDGYTGNPSNPVPAENLVEQSRAYDPAGRLASVTDVRGTTTGYTYYGDNKLASSYVVCSICGTGQESVHTYSYDAAGNQTSQTAPHGLVVNTVYDADNHVVSQIVDPSGVNRTTTAAFDANGNVVSQSLTGGGVTQTETMTYDAADQVLSQTVDNTGGNLTTTYKRDQRGLVTSQNDPAGNTTTIANDEAGRAVVKTAPAAASQTGNGSAPVTASPVTTTGYDTFGDTTEISDANGNITKYAYDQDGHQVSITEPSYTPPGASSPVNGTTTYTYDNLGQETSETDPLSNKTTYGYDQLGDKASQANPGGGTWTYGYDPAGEQTSVTDPTGAQTQATYDNLGRLVTTTDLVRQNTSAAYTTSYGYDDAGNLISQTTPTSVTTKTTYDAVGEQTSAMDGAGNTTSYAYDLDGHLVKEILPDGTATTSTYDLAGRPTSQSDLDASGTALRTQTAAYNPDGLVTSVTDPRHDTTSFSYDATGMLTSQTQPVSAGTSSTVSYGYDLDGHRTALSDGNGNTTYTTYNSRGLAETITEPHTAQYTSAANSQTVNSYDAGGNLVSQTQPGGVQVNNTFDANGNLTGQSGTGSSAPTAARTFTYDQAGRLTGATTGAAGTAGSFGYQPSTSESFTWDDRGLLLSATGTAGTTSYSYNGAGQQTSVADAAGTSSYTYDNAGRLASGTSPASGTTGSYSYNSLSQVTQISYGTGNDNQSFGYDSLHRLTSDAVKTGAGAAVASIGYGYDASNNVTSMITSGLAVPGGGTGTVTNTYGYDQANRLTSWTATPSGGTAATKTYGYDSSGNMVSNNGVTQTYDARNELTSDGNGNTYAYTANGNLAQQNGPGNAVNSFTSDAYGQQITDQASSFTWDALNRVVSAGEASNTSYSVALTYDGLTRNVASDPSDTYSRDPAGQITGVNTTSAGKSIALVNAHGDLSGTFTPAGVAMGSSTTWDPWGQVLASAGPAIQLGYQGQWNDPVTGQVNMGARMYRPAAGGFINQDTYTGGQGSPAVAGNLHAYASDNPMTFTDPTGHVTQIEAGGGPTITAADVNAERARAEAAARTAARLSAQAGQAAQQAAQAQYDSRSAAALARTLNAQATQLEAVAAKARAYAQQWYQYAQSKLADANYLLNRASAEQNQADAINQQINNYYEHGDFRDAQQYSARYGSEADALSSAAVTDNNNGTQDAIAYSRLQGWVSKFTQMADQLTSQARQARAEAQAQAQAANQDAANAAALNTKARQLAAAAAAAHRQAASLQAQYQSDQQYYHDEQVYAAANATKPKSGTAHSTGQGIYSSSMGCVTAIEFKYGACPGEAGAAGTNAKEVRDSFIGAIVVFASALLGPAVDFLGGIGGAAEEGATGSAAEDAGALCGGASFTAGTKVLLASGTAIPISQLKPGDRVLATNIKTGKTQAETVAAVLVHHDTDLYDLEIKAGTRTAVIDTTSNHLFWVPVTGHHPGRWMKAGTLTYGTHLHTPSGGYATVVGGYTPSHAEGWMWDLTIPGDHDFYIETASNTAALVHNIGGPGPCAVGQVGEDASGITKNTDTIEINGRARIPDELNQTTIGEVKNVKYLYLSTQLKDYLAYAQQNGLQFDLYVRGSTQLSAPLQELVDSGEINLIRNLP